MLSYDQRIALLQLASELVALTGDNPIELASRMEHWVTTGSPSAEKQGMTARTATTEWHN